MIWLQRPPGVASFSSTVTSYPFFASRAAVAIPPIPAPITSAARAVGLFIFLHKLPSREGLGEVYLDTLYMLSNICQYLITHNSLQNLDKTDETCRILPNTKSGGSPCKYKLIGKINFSHSRGMSHTHPPAHSFHIGLVMHPCAKPTGKPRKSPRSTASPFILHPRFSPKRNVPPSGRSMLFAAPWMILWMNLRMPNAAPNWTTGAGWSKPLLSQITTWSLPHGRIPLPAITSHATMPCN